MSAVRGGWLLCATQSYAAVDELRELAVVSRRRLSTHHINDRNNQLIVLPPWKSCVSAVRGGCVPAVCE